MATERRVSSAGKSDREDFLAGIEADPDPGFLPNEDFGHKHRQPGDGHRPEGWEQKRGGQERDKSNRDRRSTHGRADGAELGAKGHCENRDETIAKDGS